MSEALNKTQVSAEEMRKNLREQLGHLSEDVVSTINGFNPVGPQPDNVQARPDRQRMTLKELQQHIKTKNWGTVIREVSAWIFGRQNAIEGLGLRMDALNLPLHETVGYIAQIERRDTALHDFPRQFRQGYVDYEMHRTMVHRGYRRETTTAVRSVQIDAAHTSLEHYTKPPQCPSDVWSQISGDQPAIVGALRPGMTLPASMWIHFNAQNVPVCITRTDTPGAALGSFPIYVRRTGAEARTRTELENGVEYMEQHLLPGDILAVSQDGSSEHWLHEAFEVVQRRFHSAGGGPHHGTHIIVCSRPGHLLHVSANGKQELTIAEMFRQFPYNAVTAVRLTARREEFVKRVNEFAPTVLGYDTHRLGARALAPLVNGNTRIGQAAGRAVNFLSPGGNTNTSGNCICTDMVTRPAAQMGLSLGAADSPHAIVSSPDVRVAFALEMGRGATMGNPRAT